MGRSDAVLRVRLIEAFRVAATEHGFVIRESKRNWWAAYWGICAVIVGVGYFFVHSMPLRDDFSRNMAFAIIGIPMGVGFVMLSYHLRVVIDRRDNECRLQRRILWVTVFSRRLPLRGARLVPADVPVHYSHDTRPDGSGLGCVLGLLGPVGLLVEGARLIGKYEKRIRNAAGLYHVDVHGHPTPLFGTKLGHRLEPTELAAVDPVLIERDYDFSGALARRALMKTNPDR